MVGEVENNILRYVLYGRIMSRKICPELEFLWWIRSCSLAVKYRCPSKL